MENYKTVGLVSGGFDPIHAGHLDLIQAAAKGNERLIVALNSDEWLIRKKGAFFMRWSDRALILQSIREVGDVIAFDDEDDSANDALAKVKDLYPSHVINFYNGGDRTHGNILELLKYEADPRINFVFGCGGDYKRAASSEMLQDWIDAKQQVTERVWGMYNVLLDNGESKLKTLVVDPGKSLSMQKHQYRSEHWFVAEGTATVEIHPYDLEDNRPHIKTLNKHELFTVPCGWWHKLSNNGEDTLKIIEIQYGDKCVESDITRADR